MGGVPPSWAQPAGTTTAATNSLSPRRRSGERARERGISTASLLSLQTPLPNPAPEPWKHPTSNIERPTSIDATAGSHWMFDVGCWMLDVLLLRARCALGLLCSDFGFPLRGLL